MAIFSLKIMLLSILPIMMTAAGVNLAFETSQVHVFVFLLLLLP